MSFHYAGLQRWIFSAAVLLVVSLAVYSGWRYFTDRGSDATQTTRSHMRHVYDALSAFRSDAHRLPTAREGLAALRREPPGLMQWRGPYIEPAHLVDAWGRPLIYRKTEGSDDFELRSYGRDGRPGGADDDADISQR